MPFDPQLWPAGCPPDDAAPASGEVYRIVKSDPPTIMDFLTPHETGTLPKRDPCLRRSLSVYRRKADAEATMRAFPRLGI